MSEPLYPAAGDDGGLGAWLGGAADSFRTVEVTYRTWRHNQRLAEAFRSHYAEQRRRGTRIVTWAAAPGGGSSGPAETEETIRIWREDQKVRQEHHGGLRDGYYGVLDGSWWWSWSEPFGAMNGPGDSGGIDRGFEIMLDPAPLVGMLDLRMVGNSRVAGRASVTAHAVPRDLSKVGVGGYSRAFRALHALGIGADSYRLEVDQQRGVLLAITASRDGQPFYTITTVSIGFDEPIPAETFRFRPPAGEQVRTPFDLFSIPRSVPVAEATRQAPFTVLMPGRLPSGWRQMPYCWWAEASPRVPAFVVLTYRSGDGQHNVMIHQVAEADAPRSHGCILDDTTFHEMLPAGTSIKIRPANHWLQAQAYLTRDGTFTYLRAEGLTTDELAMMAAGLRPARDTGGA